MPPPRRRILSQLCVTTITALAVVALYLYLSRPREPRLPPRFVTDRLAAPISVAFNNTRLSDAFQSLSHQIGVNIAVDWTSLQSIGNYPDTLVTFELANTSASQVLDEFLLLTLQGSFVWKERDGQIVVSDDATANAPVLRIYDLSPLVKEHLAFCPAHQDDYPQGVGLFQSARFDLASRADAAVGEIMAILQNTIDVDSWIDNGGRIGRMEYAMHRLVIAQTPANHAEIQRILIALGLRDASSTDLSERHGSPP
jgi:hypothetical protein